ncbi:MAG: hypothetical protein ACRCZ6_17535 [Kluyvera sp.]|jgi:type IV pilus biogenesis protein PilP|uniref:hypothetical protein n=1 Tax=Kluyvera sp. TaxID=1538228 RepID=UPI003F37A649
MGSKFIVPIVSSVLLFSQVSAHASPTIGDISNTQQSTLMLKSALERAKLEKELSDMKDVKVSASDLCTNKGLGMLSLKAVYGVGQKRYASFFYNAASTIEGQVGDMLLCGEKIKSISLDKVDVEKDGTVYSLSGSAHAIVKK